MSETKYEVGGQVKISGKWYDILGTSNNDVVEFRTTEGRGQPTIALRFHELDFIVEEYRPPVKPVEWITLKDFQYLTRKPVSNLLNETNEFLSEKYGDPTIRKYNDEPASDFGLMDNSCVLFWDSEDWAGCSFGALAYGDIWMKQPRPPHDLL